jgi:hypothetical protein
LHPQVDKHAWQTEESPGSDPGLCRSLGLQGPLGRGLPIGSVRCGHSRRASGCLRGSGR